MSFFKKPLVQSAVKIASIALMLTASQSALAAGGQWASVGTEASLIGSIIAIGWIKDLITSALAVWTLIEIFSRWKDFWSGSNMFNNALVVAAFCAATIWWPSFVAGLTSLG